MYAKKNSSCDVLEGCGANQNFSTIHEAFAYKLGFIRCERMYLGGNSLHGIFRDSGNVLQCLWPWGTKNDFIQKRSAYPFEPFQNFTVRDLFYILVDWGCFAQRYPALVNPYQVLIHYYPSYANVMLPVCLAVDPLMVVRETLPFFSGDLVKISEQKKCYQQLIDIIKDIAQNVPQNMNEVQKICQQKILVQEMMPVEIFTIVLNKIAQRRQKDIRFTKMHDSLNFKVMAFCEADNFAFVPKITNTKDLSSHLFLK